MNSNHHIIFKCIGFMSSRCVGAINLDIAPSFNVFNKFYFMSQ